jgi:endoglucanase Acf2
MSPWAEPLGRLCALAVTITGMAVRGAVADSVDATAQVNASFPLTPALSLGEREQTGGTGESSRNGELIAARKQGTSPLLAEGGGGGEADPAQNRSGLISVGAGGYTTRLPEGAKAPPVPRCQPAAGRLKMPTSDWWSSLAWSTNSFAQFPHPLAVRPEPAGLRIAYPGARITANRSGIFGGMPGGLEDFILGHSSGDLFSVPLPTGFSGWFVTARFSAGTNFLETTYGHGSPFVYAGYGGGQARLLFGLPPDVWAGDENSSALGITVHGRHYGLFGPSGAKWEGLGGKTLLCRSPQPYFSVALLPDNTGATLALFQRHAHSHVVNTLVDWRYEPATSAVRTTFRFVTEPREGTETNTLFSLYPHQWRHAETPLLPLTYGSVRGLLKLGVGPSFTTRMTFPGVLPALPEAGGCTPLQMAELFRPEVEKAQTNLADTYWNGKQLGRWATLIPIAEQYSLTAQATALRERLRGQLETWLSPGGSDGQPKRRGLFHYDSRWGTLIGYPASYGSDVELNDHHFHYGYFIKGAAEIARRDPAWAADPRWGGMVMLLIRDIASPDPDDPLFPWLRCFDPYAGHSWASGHARFGDGNNNESSSEAMNAWCGIILWGEATGDAALRDLGIFLFTTEMSAIQEYWFDVHGENFPKPYPASVVTMVWGGKGANATWFSADPQLVHGINWLPLHGGSLYLGLDSAYAEKNYLALVAEHRSDRFTQWADLAWMYRTLSDPADAVRLFETAGSEAKFEGGNSRVNLVHWLYNLRKLGRVDGSVTADHPLYAVFRTGRTRHYAAYNAAPVPRAVHFSDGFTLQVDEGCFGCGARTVAE